LASIESILERLADLETSLMGGAVQTRAAAAPDSKSLDTFAEKKTLKTDEAAPESLDTSPFSELTYQIQPDPEPAVGINLDFLRNMPVRLPPIPSEELEHIEDPWLDEAYERKLMWSGDDLTPILGTRAWLNGLSDDTAAEKQTVAISPSNGNSTTTAAAAVAIALAETTENSASDTVDLPQLSESPTEEELFSYAQVHPAVRAALKVFRGKIVNVKRSQ
jgi:hypothetical protein